MSRRKLTVDRYKEIERLLAGAITGRWIADGSAPLASIALGPNPPPRQRVTAVEYQ